MFFFLNYLFNCRETRVPWCPLLPGLGSLPESLRVLLFGFLRALCNAVILTPSASGCKKALVPWITGSLHPNWSVPKPASGRSVDLVSCWSHLPAAVIRRPGADILQASYGHHGRLSWDELTGVTDIWWQFAGINYRPLYWPMGTDGQKWKFNTFHQFLLHPSCHHHKT